MKKCLYLYPVFENKLKKNVLHKLVYIAGRPKAALLFWFFGGVRCGFPLFIIILVIY